MYTDLYLLYKILCSGSQLVEPQDPRVIKTPPKKCNINVLLNTFHEQKAATIGAN